MLKRIFLALLSFFFSPKKKARTTRQLPYRELFVPDDPVEQPVVPTRDPWHTGLSRIGTSFKSWVENKFDHVVVHLERIRSVMVKLILIAVFFGCILGVGALYDVNSPTTLGLRWAGAISCIILGLLSGGLFIGEMDASSNQRY